MVHIIGQEQHYGLLQCSLISILLYLSHLLQDETLYLPQIMGQIYTSANRAHPDQEQFDNGLYSMTFDLHSDMYMYALMKHADHFLDSYVNNFWCLNIYEFRPKHAFYLTVYLSVTCEYLSSQESLKQNRTVLKLFT